MFTCEIRVPGMLAVAHAGSILNSKAARSQMIGAKTMGAGAALTEELVLDKKQVIFLLLPPALKRQYSFYKQIHHLYFLFFGACR